MSLMRTKTSNSASEKLLAYDALAGFNQGFSQILQNLRSLDTLGFLKGEISTALQVTLEETRAWANFEVIERLHEREEKDWARFGRLRLQWEKKVEDAGNVLLEAARLKMPRQKSGEGKRRRRP